MESGYQYENNVLKFFPHAEGYVTKEGSTYRHVFTFTDHLGNIRLKYCDLNQNGSIETNEILEENHYYPFGLKHEGYNGDVSVLANRYRYNQKEWQDELGLDVYDYGGRVYDPIVPRFWQIDPMADDREWLSTYNYVQNNPVIRIDPDGLLDDLAVEFTDPPIKNVDNTSRLSGWNKAAQKMSNDFYNKVQEFSRDPINEGIKGLSNTLNSAALLVGDVTGLSNLMGMENKTATGIANAIDTVAEIPNMTNEQQGAAMAVVTVAVVETVATRKTPAGRTGRQERLRDIVNDPKAGKADKGWVKQEINQIDRGKRTSIRNPPGKVLAHERGREAAKGYSYKHTNLQNQIDHRNQHRYDNNGRHNKERRISH